MPSLLRGCNIFQLRQNHVKMKSSQPEQFPNQTFESEFSKAVEEIQIAVFQSVLKSSLELPLEQPRLGMHLSTWPEKIQLYMQPMIDAAHAASVVAVRSAIYHVGPLSKLMPHYAAALRAQVGRRAEKKRKTKKGGRPSKTLWRDTSKNIWLKNGCLTATAMIERLEAKGIIQRDAGRIVFNDEYGIRTSEEKTEQAFLACLNTHKYQILR